MGTLVNGYNALKSKAKEKLGRLIQRRGVESKFSNKLVLKVKDKQQFNVGGRGSYVVEISDRELIDNNGYQYGLSSITLEQLCELIDNA